MKVAIKDTQAMLSLSPTDITSYLRSIGAVAVGEYRQKATVWSLEDAEFLVPKNRSVGDYALRVSETLNELSKIENRSTLDIFYDISLIGFDIYRFRNSSEETRAGTLPLAAGMEFVASSKELLMSAACSAYSAKLNYPSKKPHVAEEYVNQVRMAAEKGSFVITLLAPIDPILVPQQQSLLEINQHDTMPYEHRIGLMLNSGLRTLEDVARKAAEIGKIDPFLNNAEKGVSANLCEAVTRLHQSAQNGLLEIGITWSRNRNTKRRYENITINRDYIPVIREAARTIKLSIPEQSQTIKGVVTQLHKEPFHDKGRVTILDVASGQARRVQVDLPDSEYQRALSAHRDFKDIEISGDLTRNGRTWELKNPSSLLLIEDALDS